MAGLRLSNVAMNGGRDGWTCEVPIGHIRGIVLPNEGCAHTLTELLLGFVQPTVGSVSLADGEPIGAATRSAPSDGVRYVPAGGGLFPHSTVLDNVAYHARRGGRESYGLAKAKARREASGFGLDDVLHRYPHEITAGRRKLAGLMRALSQRPALLVLGDADDLPRWGALLATTGYRPTNSRTSARTPELLAGAATVLLTTSARRSFGLDNDPIVPPPGVFDAAEPA